jgi:hypothetical protein
VRRIQWWDEGRTIASPMRLHGSEEISKEERGGEINGHYDFGIHQNRISEIPRDHNLMRMIME